MNCLYLVNYSLFDAKVTRQLSGKRAYHYSVVRNTKMTVLPKTRYDRLIELQKIPVSFATKPCLLQNRVLLNFWQICHFLSKNTEYSKRYWLCKSDRFWCFQLLYNEMCRKCRNDENVKKSLIPRQFHSDCDSLQNANSFKIDPFSIDLSKSDRFRDTNLDEF